MHVKTNVKWVKVSEENTQREMRNMRNDSNFQLDAGRIQPHKTENLKHFQYCAFPNVYFLYSLLHILCCLNNPKKLIGHEVFSALTAQD